MTDGRGRDDLVECRDPYEARGCHCFGWRRAGPGARSGSETELCDMAQPLLRRFFRPQ